MSWHMARTYLPSAARPFQHGRLQCFNMEARLKYPSFASFCGFGLGFVHKESCGGGRAGYQPFHDLGLAWGI